MSVAEVKAQIEKLSPADRDDLAQFLRSRRLIDSAEYRARVMEAERDIDAGRYATLEQLKELLAKNQATRRAS